MIYEEIMYGIKCNRCHEIFENSDGYVVTHDKYDFEEEAQENGWYKEGDAHYCPNCHTRDDIGIVTVKPQIHYTFFKFWNLLKTFTGCLHCFGETENYYTLTSYHCYKRLDDARISILREIVADFTIEYRKPEKVNGRPCEIVIISIPKNFKKR